MTPPLPQAVNEALDQACRTALHEKSFAVGLSMAVTDRDGILASGAFGHADLAAALPTAEDTLFQIGSISKGLTAALLLRARDAGLVDLDKPVTEYLPWFSVRSAHAPITVRHLMSHTAGIIAGTDVSGDSAFEVWALRDTEATTPPGTWFHYSNSGYKALGLVLEAICQRPYQELLGDFLAELGMSAAVPAITHEIRTRSAVGYLPRYDDRVPVREDGVVPATWLETATADGSVASTARDMTGWLRVLMGNGSAALSKEALTDLTSPEIRIEGEDFSYGLGMIIGEFDGRPHVWHTGGMIGYFAALAYDVDAGIGAVVLANGMGPWQETVVHLIAATRAARSGDPVPEFALPERKPPMLPTPDDPPAHWAEVVGHYRCHNPWLSNLHVYAHDNRLWASIAGGPPNELVPLPDGSFRVGEDERLPERLKFDVVLNGVAVRADYCGCPLYRTFTP
ncbi:serine hydrolase [Amycolatopsis sp. AA4]|uniref:serine hydrolase domain-containing protein n=1 Tax=Actinomycetes TaxID=1760 RepID=UPI0001B55648|nr:MULTISPECIES: serine hydrolase domain-containing protein [Actinomycetes]ATY14092.1 serine hydrolase [Amycolatopsis sp. AA4]